MNVVPITGALPVLRTGGEAADFGPFACLAQHRPLFERRGRLPLGEGALNGIVVEVGTLEAATGEELLVELALCRFTADGEGRIVELGRPQFHLEDPDFGSGRDAARVKGLSSSAPGRRRIRDGEASCALMSADAIVGVDAGFIRPLLERRLPEIVGRRWVSVPREIGRWRLGRHDPNVPDLLAASVGRDGGRHAASRLNALLHLLDHRLPDGRVVLAVVLGMPPWSTETDRLSISNR